MALTSKGSPFTSIDLPDDPPNPRQIAPQISAFTTSDSVPFFGTGFQRIPRDRWRTVIAFFSLIFVSFCSTLCLAFIHDHWPRQPPLPDVVFWLIPPQKWAWYLADYATGTSTWMCLIAAIFHRHRWVLFRRIFLIFAVLYLFRCLTITVTILPLPYDSNLCLPQLNRTHVDLVFQRALR